MSTKFSTNRKRKSRKRGSRRRIGRKLAIFLYFAALVILVALYFSQQQIRTNPPKKPASLYFQITPLLISEGDKVSNDTWLVRTISFMIQPVGGNAKDVHIEWAFSDPWDKDFIAKNSSEPVILSSSPPQEIQVDDQGMIPVEIKVISNEAEGRITILFPQPKTE